MMRSGTHSSARPSFFARRASIVLPVSSRSSAAGAPVEPRQALHAAPAGHDAEHHLGQAESRRRLVDDDAIAAGERQLEAAAEAEAADQRERRIRHGGEPLERVPAALDERDRVGLGLDVAELVDVGAGDESVRLARADDETLRRIAVELRRAPRGIRRDRRADSVLVDRAGLVEREPREAVRVARRASSVACGGRSVRALTDARPASRRPGRRRCRSRPCRACRRCARAR